MVYLDVGFEAVQVAQLLIGDVVHLDALNKTRFNGFHLILQGFTEICRALQGFT